MSSPLQIMLAEDNPPDVFLVRTALEEADLTFNLHVCSDGEQAFHYVDQIEKAAAACPNIFILDLNLPRHSGEEVLEKLRGNRQLSSVPVIVITSSDSPRDRERVGRLGISHYFCKPLELAEFMKLGGLVSALLRRGKASPAAG